MKYNLQLIFPSLNFSVSHPNLLLFNAYESLYGVYIDKQKTTELWSFLDATFSSG